MNPARSLALALVSGNFSSLWLYIFAPIIGAILAAFTQIVLLDNVIFEKDSAMRTSNNLTQNLSYSLSIWTGRGEVGKGRGEV